MFRSLRLAPRVVRSARWNSTSSPTTPPLMATLRTDLKTAMRAKDTDRLNVLRALISETNNSQKTSSPIQTDLQLLALIKKRVAAAKDSGQQFLEANRPDLKEKEDKALAILEEYGGHVQTMGLDEIKQIVSQEVSNLKEAGRKVEIGGLLKSLFAPGGALDGKPAERSEVAKIAKEAVSSA
ncbi:hypothetical protein P175DRAFT_0535635 [Aspergillus ochraceoroseus IBT 24754]|uniref:Altered inheritance of mitochondria protein 41 n=2 Tax=Aspergillus ochraceoroseus TaxID=138278 RepID=A0A2T5LNP2_9EURO|nr:uncharacterized protein P175DRAFT_0535635 [Aspergillus ochraceoroseus IBT 24754]KKK24868.1 hypothetical protein AOCH_004604 [Aspergillus ochraceoroseus]PTU17892.1 hypothetical protein P175DRAFT_0535635 [Aspergillus ochraceoroseus IBT 24754]